MSKCSEWNRASLQPQVLMQNKECFCFFFFFSILSLNTLVKQAGRKTTQILHLSHVTDLHGKDDTHTLYMRLMVGHLFRYAPSAHIKAVRLHHKSSSNHGWHHGGPLGNWPVVNGRKILNNQTNGNDQCKSE